MLDSIKPTGEDLEIIKGFIKGPEVTVQEEGKNNGDEELNEENVKDLLKSMNET